MERRQQAARLARHRKSSAQSGASKRRKTQRLACWRRLRSGALWQCKFLARLLATRVGTRRSSAAQCSAASDRRVGRERRSEAEQSSAAADERRVCMQRQFHSPCCSLLPRSCRFDSACCLLLLCELDGVLLSLPLILRIALSRREAGHRRQLTGSARGIGHWAKEQGGMRSSSEQGVTLAANKREASRERKKKSASARPPCPEVEIFFSSSCNKENAG